MDLQNAFTELFKHGISGGLVAIIWYLIHQKNQRNGGDSKKTFLEELGAMMAAQTKLLTEVANRQEKIEPMIMKVDEKNWPLIWGDHNQQVRTHEAVNNILEVQKEVVEVLSEVHKMQRGGNA